VSSGFVQLYLSLRQRDRGQAPFYATVMNLSDRTEIGAQRTPILVVVTRSCGSRQAAADTDAVKPAAVQAGTCRVHIVACHLVEGGRAARRGHRPASHPLRD